MSKPGNKSKDQVQELKDKIHTVEHENRELKRAFLQERDLCLGFQIQLLHEMRQKVQAELTRLTEAQDG
ncbi:MAG: hypothetical protein ACLFUU_01735 [Desulfobacteraceae bacterium]